MFEKYEIINVNNSIYLLENSKGEKYEKAIKESVLLDN